MSTDDQRMADYRVQRGGDLSGDLFDDSDIDQVELLGNALAEQITLFVGDVAGRMGAMAIDPSELERLAYRAVSAAYSQGVTAQVDRENKRSREETGRMLGAVLSATIGAG